MSESPATIMRLHSVDTVAVALNDIAEGDIVSVDMHLTAREFIPRGHKVALVASAVGDVVVKYGAPIGVATRPILPGQYVHVQNMRTALDDVEHYIYAPMENESAATPGCETFLGYRRANGEVAIRNEVWIIPTVGCVNGVVERLARLAAQQFWEAPIDGIHAFTHPFGCSQLGDDHRATQGILAGLCQHPHAGGVLIVGLGCENNQLNAFSAQLGEIDVARVRFLNCQQVEDEIAVGLELIAELVQHAAHAMRESLPFAALKVGLKCGGSDAFSGITANPLLGRFSDRLIESGGSCMLTEVPEMFGAEERLLQRCVDVTVFQKLVAVVNEFKAYYYRYGQAIHENPSPGNNDGGITTLEEKSLGCVAKGGESPIVDVLPYGGRLCAPGLNVLCGPGNDLVAVTALVAAGAHMVLFTTGRGTSLGSPVPTVKVASNSALAERKPHWIDFDAGTLLAGQGMDEVCWELVQLVTEVASGKRTRNEEHGYREIAIWKDGVTL